VIDIDSSRGSPVDVKGKGIMRAWILLDRLPWATL
jgi:hypothetical protein